MKVLTKNRLRMLLVLAAVFLLSTSVLASSDLSHQLDWYTVDGGGGDSSSGTYSLSGTIGQADAGTLSSATYTLVGGFWGGGQLLERLIHLPIILK